MIDLNINKKIFVPAFYPHLRDYSKRYEVYYGGAGSGKSVFVTQKLLIKALSDRRKALIIRKVGTTIKDSVFQLVIDTLESWKIVPYCKVNLTTYSVVLPNGSIILFKSLDDKEKIKSITGITDIWIEEATELTLDDFTQLDLRLRAKAANLQMFLSFNPVSKINWVYRHWFEQSQPNTLIVRTTYKDNPFLPQSYVDSLEQMAATNPTYYRIYALGEFCSLDKLVYTNWTVSEAEPPQDAQLIVGLDFGYANDPSALVVAHIAENSKEIYVSRVVARTGMLNNEIAALIKYMGLSKEVIIADSAEVKSIEEIKREGIYRIKPAAKGAGSIQQGIQKLQQYKIIVNPQCTDIITELQNYSYRKDKNTNEYTNEPVDSFNHCLDALRYALQCVSSRPKIQTLHKASFGL